MSGYSRPIGHPAGIISSNGPLRLFGRRIMLRPLVATDFEAWSEVRLRNGEWLTQNGNIAEKAGHVEVYSDDDYVNWEIQQPAMLFHELVH